MSQRILVVGTSFGGGNWPPLAAVTMGLSKVGHEVQCFGDGVIAQDLASAVSLIRVAQAESGLRTFMDRWIAGSDEEPSPFRRWAEDCLPVIRAVVDDFRPQIVLSEIFTAELARLIKATFSVPWCCVNPGYYFGPHSLRPAEADFVARSRYYRQQFWQSISEADLVLHATDARFDPPPRCLPHNHHYVGPLWWERAGEAPAYLDDPGAPWVLVTVSSAPQPEEAVLIRTAIRALAAYPVRVLLTLSNGHTREEVGIIPDNVLIEKFVSHAAVLQRSCLVISHAGHGIVMKALYYGVPMVLVPWGRDQPGVAARAAALGAAEVVLRQDVTQLLLKTAIDRVMTDPNYKENAARMSRRLKENDSVATARRWIENMLVG